MKGVITGLIYDFGKKKTIVQVEIEGNVCNQLEQLKGKVLSVIFKIFREKRSLNANALCWKLCTEIANVLRSDKDSVYIDMLKSYGQSEVVSVLSSIDIAGYFKYYEVFGTGYVNGKEFTHYKVFKGSSEYDTYEMSVLLDGIVSQAKELDIPVLTERELALIKGEWATEGK